MDTPLPGRSISKWPEPLLPRCRGYAAELSGVAEDMCIDEFGRLFPMSSAPGGLAKFDGLVAGSYQAAQDIAEGRVVGASDRGQKPRRPISDGVFGVRAIWHCCEDNGRIQEGGSPTRPARCICLQAGAPARPDRR